MRTAADSREIRGREEIVRPDFHPGKRNPSAELTGDSPGQMAGVIKTTARALARSAKFC
jgi:hypothetical protein